MVSGNESHYRTCSIPHISVTNTVYLNVANSVERVCNERIFLENLYLTKFSFYLDFENTLTYRGKNT